jgi:hypothetical protein
MNGDQNRAVAKVAGLTLHELAAVLGVTPSALSQLLGPRFEHRATSCLVTWFLGDCPKTFVQSALRRWTKERPRDSEHLKLLQKIAKRRFGVRYKNWYQSMLTAHPDLCQEK